MKLLIITNLFPNSKEPIRGMYNKQQFAELTKTCELEVVAPLPYHHFLKVPYWEIIDGVQVHHPRYFMTPKLGRSLYGFYYFFGIVGKIRDIYSHFKFDCILATWAYPDGFAAGLIAKMFKKPLVIKVHGSDINLHTRYRLRRLMIVYTLNRCAKVIAVSNALKKRMVDIGVLEEKIEVISNGVDMDKFFPMDNVECRKKLNLPLEKKLVLYVGNLVEVKGPDILIEAASRLPENVRVIMIGSGALEDSLKEKVKLLKLDNKVTFAGVKPHKDIPLWINAADVLCLPSLHEGCPNVVLESMACGRPVVASRVGGLEEIVHTDDMGILVKSGDPLILTGALSRALDKVWDYNAIKEKSIDCDWADNAAKLKNELDRALESSISVRPRNFEAKTIEELLQ